MAGKALVSGCDERVGQVAEELRREGLDVVEVAEPSGLREAARGFAPGELSVYVQLPVNVDVAGATLVGRVQMFLQRGLIARYDAVDAVLPALRDDATVVLVSGNAAVEGGGMPDDASARFALLNVLAHAIRAEKAPGIVRVRMVPAGTGPDRVAGVAVGRERARPQRDLEDLRAREDEMSYEDWRTEVMGLATVEV